MVYGMYGMKMNIKMRMNVNMNTSMDMENGNMNNEYICVLVLFEYYVGKWSGMKKWNGRTSNKTINSTKTTNQ